MSVDELAITLLCISGAILFGVAAFVALHPSKRWRPVRAGDLGWALLRVIFWVCVVALVLVGFSGFIPAVAVVCVGVLVYQRYRKARQQAMLSTLAVAAERRISLASALRAVAAERRGPAARRARQVAAYLESGATLPDALGSAGGFVPRLAMLKIRVGQELGELPQALREAGETDVAADSTRAQLSGKLIYLGLLALFMIQILVFVMWRIAPSFEKIFKDFNAPLPPVTKTLNAVSYAALDYGSLWLLPLFLVFLYVLAWAVAGFEANFPVLRRLAARLDTAAILESLALATGRQRPMTQGLLALAMHYPKGWVRRRLDRVFTTVCAGADWIDSLRAQGLIRPADLAVLRAAERAGNLPWAMREVAESNRRRFNYRVYVLLQWLFPLAILLAGLTVAVFAVGYFTPLIALIQRLA